MHLKYLAVLLCMQAGTGQAAWAQEAPIPPVELTAPLLEKFVGTFPELADKLSKADPEFDVADTESLIGQISLMIEGDPDESALDTIAANKGFATFEEWGNLANNILLARLWAQNPPDLADISASEAEIMALSDISQDEKAEMIQGLHEAVGLAQDQKPSDANIGATQPFLDRLEGILGSME